jgi:hypothetical protein
MKQWGKKRDNLYYLIEFGSLKKKPYDYVFYFNIRFNKMYNNIPRGINPLQ